MVLSIWTWMKQVTELWLTNSQLMLHMKYLLYSWLRIGVIEYKLQNKNIRSINMTSNLNVILSDIFCICSSSSYSWFSIFFKETCNHVITRKPTNFTQGGVTDCPPLKPPMSVALQHCSIYVLEKWQEYILMMFWEILRKNSNILMVVRT